jgi:hypothetical protein
MTAADQPDVIVEDALCRGLGRLLDDARQEPIDDRPGPHHVAQAIVAAAAASAEAALEANSGQVEAWRVLAAVAGILPYPDREAADNAINRLRNSISGRRVLPTVPAGPVLSGPVSWTRDRYGSRFAVTAPIITEGQPQRWYLWDIDTCGHDTFTVHSGFYATEEAALAAWQAGVGPIAAAGTVLTVVDDPWLMAELLPAEQGFIRVGGENVEQFTEYHRSKRLAELVKQAMPYDEARATSGLDTATAAVEFTAWLRARDVDPTHLPEHLDELATEIAESWCISRIGALFATCSPHRVALCVLHMRNFYRRIRRPTPHPAPHVDPLAGRARRHPTGTGRALPALRTGPTPPTDHGGRPRARLSRTGHRIRRLENAESYGHLTRSPRRMSPTRRMRDTCSGCW